MYLPNMTTVYLKLLLSIALMFVVADYNLTEEKKNCSLSSGQISTDEVSLLEYDVRLTLISHAEVILGITDITIYVNKPTTNIRLHARNLEVNIEHIRIILDTWNESHYKVGRLVLCPEHETLLIVLADFLPRGQFILHMEHISTFNKSLNKVSYPYSRTGSEKRWLITNLFAPNAIRSLFPCWDDPTIKSYFRIKIKHEKFYTVISNALKRDISIIEDNMQWTYFRETNLMSTYSLAIAVVSNITKDPKYYDIHYLWHSSKVNEIFQHAHLTAYNVMLYSSFNLGFIMKNIIKNVNHVILPNSPMRSSGKLGLIIYREKDVAYNKHTDFYGKQIEIAKLVAYETTRQLFVDYIGPYLKKDWWINEIFASYYCYHVLSQIYSKEIIDMFIVQNLLTALDIESSLEQEPIIHKAKYDDGIEGLLYPLLYHKKAFALIRMLYHLLSPPKFNEAIKQYVLTHNTDLWTVLQKVYLLRNNSMYTIKEIMDSWLTKKYHAELQITREYDNNVVEYRATFASKNIHSKIPLTYATPETISSYDTSNITWYEGRQTKFITGFDAHQFFLVNMELVGYYRVNYDKRNWQLLSDYLQSNNSIRIPVLNRAQIVNDAFYFTTVEKIESAFFFDIIQFLKNEKDYIAWYPMFNIFSYMSTYFKFSASESTKKNFTNILDGLLQNIGYVNNPMDTNEMITALRLLAIKWACDIGHTQCRDVTTKKLIAYIYYDDTQIFPWFANWMYCAGIMTANMTVWQKVLKTGNQHKNIELLESLSCSENEIIIIHYLYLLLNTDLGTETGLHMEKTFNSIIKKHVKKDAVLDYVLDNYNEILSRFPFFDNGILMGNIIMNVYSNKQLDKIEQFIMRKYLYEDYGMWSIFLTWSTERRSQFLKMQQKFRMF